MPRVVDAPCFFKLTIPISVFFRLGIFRFPRQMATRHACFESRLCLVRPFVLYLNPVRQVETMALALPRFKLDLVQVIMVP